MHPLTIYLVFNWAVINCREGNCSRLLAFAAEQWGAGGVCSVPDHRVLGDALGQVGHRIRGRCGEHAHSAPYFAQRAEVLDDEVLGAVHVVVEQQRRADTR